jgi:4a-hydroxytetrahydrobiopterin dehydratase
MLCMGRISGGSSTSPEAADSRAGELLMTKKLSDAERAAILPTLANWTYLPDRDAIERRLSFGDFSEAFAFMTRVAMLAEKHDHHPEWSNVWNRLTILLITHDVSGLSERDVALARAIDNLLKTA